MLFAQLGAHCSFVAKSLSQQNSALIPIDNPTKTEGKGHILFGYAPSREYGNYGTTTA
jgi:hypothetical protein